MGSLRKLIASVSVFALIFTITGLNTIVNAAIDVPGSAYFFEAHTWAVAEGIVDDADYFRPSDNMNRAEMAKMVVEGLGVAMDTTGGPSFLDVSESEWYYDDVETGVANGLFSGYTDADGMATGYYGPGDYTTRAAVAKVLMLAYGFEMAECATTFSDVDYSAWYGPYMDSACHYGILTQGRPGDLVNRAEFVTMLNRAATYEPGDEVVDDDDEEDDEVVVVPPSSGTVMVSVAPSTPAANIIPADAASVTFATLAFTALGDDVTVNGVTLWRDGLGSTSDFSEVWLSVDGFKLGSERSLNSDGNAVVNLGRDYISIPEGQTVLVDVKASMGTSVGANRTNRLGTRTAADVDTNAASVSGSFGLYGNYMTTSSYTVGTVGFQRQGSATTVDVGDTQVIIGEFQIDNNSSSNEDFVLSTIDLEINGSANFDNIANAAIYYLGEKVSDTLSPIDDHLRFTFLDGGYLLGDGDNEKFQVKADIVGGDDADTIYLQLSEDNDFTVFVATTAYNYAVDVARTSPTTGVLRTYTIDAGALTLARHTSSPSATEITDDIDGVTFLVAQVTVQQDVKVKATRVYLDADIDTLANGTTAAVECSGSGTTATIDSSTSVDSTTEETLTTTIAAKIDDVKVWDGARLAAGGANTLADVGTVAFASGVCGVANAYYTFSDNYDLDAGLHLLSVTADVSSYASAAETFSLSLDNTPSGWLSAEYIVSGDDVATGDINGSATGSIFTVEASTLTLSRQDGYPTDSTSGNPANDGNDIVKGSTDIVLLTFKAENNNAGDVTITDMDITEQYASTNVDGALVTGLGIYESGTDNLVVSALKDLGSAASTVSSSIAQFDGINYVVPSGGFALFDVRGSISTSWDVATDLDLFLTGFAADDVNNNSATIVYPDYASGSTTADLLAFASFDVNDSANLTIAFDARVDSDYTDLQVPTGQCTDGSCAALVAQLEFHPTFDDVILKKLVLNNDDNTTDYSQRFGTFFLVDEATGDVIDTGSLSDDGTNDGTVTFNGFSYRLPKDAYYNLNVLAEINSITYVSQTGASLNLFLYDSATTDTTTAARLQVTSEATGTDLDVTDTDILTNSADDTDAYQQTHIARKTVPYVTYNNDELLSTSVSSNETGKPVYKFTISADDAGDIEWTQLTFNAVESDGTATGISTSNFLLYVEGQSSALNSAASLASGEVVIDATQVQSVPAGDSVTYVLKTDIAITGTASQALSIELTAEDDDDVFTNTETTLGAGTICASETETCDFVWSDRSAQSHTTSTADWTTGYQVDDFDIDIVNIT
ncbi:MAG: S-layer homology domain-containing protein, partial [Candidatus Gracilibacteria bacterium]|nr:S-layer homology domain-containing protein [Candidatus Gracilibacteria bacterium]